MSDLSYADLAEQKAAIDSAISEQTEEDSITPESLGQILRNAAQTEWAHADEFGAAIAELDGDLDNLTSAVESLDTTVTGHVAAQSTFHGLTALNLFHSSKTYFIHGTDNATTDAAALTAARTALLAEGGGTILFDGTLNLSSVGLFLMGSSTVPLGLLGVSQRTSTLRFSGDPSTYLHWGHLASIFPSNNKIDGAVVTKSSPFGTIDGYRWWQFTSNDADDLEPGDWIYVWSEDAADRLNSLVTCQGRHHCPGYFVEVKAVDGNLVTLNHEVPDYMTTLWIHKRDIVRGPFTVGNFRVTCDAVEEGTRSLSFRSVVDFTCENITYEKDSCPGIGMTGCANFDIRNIKHRGIPESAIGIVDSVIATNACTNWLIDGVQSTELRHHYDNGAVTSVDDASRIGGDLNGTVSNWTATGATHGWVNLTYTGGAGLGGPDPGEIITWTSPPGSTGTGRVVQIVSGNASAGTMRVRISGLVGPTAGQTLSVTGWTATLSSVGSPTQYGAPFTTHEGGYGLRFVNCKADYHTQGLNYPLFFSRSRYVKFINCEAHGNNLSYGFRLQGAKNEVRSCIIDGAFIGVWFESGTSTSTSQIPKGNEGLVAGCTFRRCRQSVILHSMDNTVERNTFFPCSELNSSGGFNYAPITVRTGKTGQRILHNSFVRGTNVQGAIWCETSDLISELLGNTFSGYTDEPSEGPATSTFPFHVGTQGSTTDDAALFEAYKTKNFGLVAIAAA